MTRDEFDDFLDRVQLWAEPQEVVNQWAGNYYPNVLKLIPCNNGEFIVVRSRITNSRVKWD